MGIFEVSESPFPQGGAFAVSDLHLRTPSLLDGKPQKMLAMEVISFTWGAVNHCGDETCEFQVLQLQVMVGFTYKYNL